MPILELIGLSKNFGNLQAVDNLDMAIEEGEIRGLIGPNGAGKTTVFNLVTGFLRPTHGKVIWQGRDISRMQPETIAKIGICRTFQLTTLFKEMSALQNVILAYHLEMEARLFQQFLDMKKERDKELEIKEKAISLMELLGISHVKDEIAGELSHGYKRALGMAIALATMPKLLLLDEPLTGMNPTEVSQIIETFRTIRDRGITLFIVEHNMKAMMSICEKITVLSFGSKIAEGKPEEVSKNEEVLKAYLGEEYTYA